MRASFTLLAAAAATFVSAQVQNYTSSLDMTISPDSVDRATRSSWCTAQINTCDALCDSTKKNDCDDNTLKWDCLCSKNGSAPGLQYYTETMPTFICQELFAECISATSTQQGTLDCQENIQSLCGTKKPPALTSDDDDDDSTSTTASSSPTSATTSSSGSDSSATTEGSATSTSSDGFAAPTMAPAGKGAVAAVAIGMLALFA